MGYTVRIFFLRVRESKTTGCRFKLSNEIFEGNLMDTFLFGRKDKEGYRPNVGKWDLCK